MNTFELKTDTSIPFVKIIRFIGTLLMGFTIGALVFQYKYGVTIDWTPLFILAMSSFYFAFFPGRNKYKSLTFDEDGITLNRYPYYLSSKNEYKWDTIKSITISKKELILTKNIGATANIKLPLHTRQQLDGLKKYLQHLAEEKNIVYQP